MRIAVVGLGGVGGYLSAMLAKSGVDVVGFGRGEHLKKIQESGICIVEDEAKWSVPLKAMEIEDAEGYFDIILFCVKSYDLQEAYTKMAKHRDADSILLSLSNGVDNAQRLQKLSDSIVLEGAIYILSHIEKAGVIRKKGSVFALVFGGENQEAIERLATLFDSAKLRYKIATDIKVALWKKYIFISAFATLTSYYNETIGAIYEKHYEEAKRVLEEIASFAYEDEGIKIDDEVQKALETAKKVPYDSSTSMYLDFQNGKKTELESLSGYVKKPLMIQFYKKLKGELS